MYFALYFLENRMGIEKIFIKNYIKCEEILHYICQNQAPGKKMVQKLIYLIERKGVDLGLNYSIHFYRPYSVASEGSKGLLSLVSLD